MVIGVPTFRFVYQEIEEFIGDMESNQIDITEDGLLLVQKLNHITNQELSEIYDGAFEMRITKINNAVWFTFQFGSNGWDEAPFSLHLAQLAEKTTYMQYCDMLRIVLVDTENGRVAVLLEIDLNQTAKKLLKKYIDETYRMPFSKDSYHANLLSVQSCYSVEQIASASTQILYLQ